MSGRPTTTPADPATLQYPIGSRYLARAHAQDDQINEVKIVGAHTVAYSRVAHTLYYSLDNGTDVSEGFLRHRLKIGAWEAIG